MQRLHLTEWVGAWAYLQFSIIAGYSFADLARNDPLAAGQYEIHLRDESSGICQKSPIFSLLQTRGESGVRYSDDRLTLYSVPAGNTRLADLPDQEF